MSIHNTLRFIVDHNPISNCCWFPDINISQGNVMSREVWWAL